MDTAIPEGAPPWRFGDEKFKKTPIPLCLRETLRRGSFLRKTIFMDRV